MKTRQELKQNPELLKDKCRGAIIGIAIGDSFGDASRKPDAAADALEAACRYFFRQETEGRTR